MGQKELVMLAEVSALPRSQDGLPLGDVNHYFEGGDALTPCLSRIYLNISRLEIGGNG
jgi:hypothetical protein